jgi:tetratricopeptide (TPR) repeat protein
MDSIVTTELKVPAILREPTDAEVQSAKEALAKLEAEARALGRSPGAARVHYAMGRIYVEQLGDQKSAAICYQNAFLLAPHYRPTLEAARRLFVSAGRMERALALHQREAELLDDPEQKAESLRAQANLLRKLGRDDEAAKLVERGLSHSPEHPALLAASVEAARRSGDRLDCARLLLRSAGATRDPVHKAQLLRRAVMLLEGLLIGQPQPDVQALHDEAARKLFQADPNDQIGFHAMVLRARSANDWEAVLRLLRQRAERTQSPADRATVAAVAAHRLGRVSEGLAEVAAALENNRRDAGLLALRTELAELQKSPDLPELLRQRAEGCTEPSERANLKMRAALLLADALEREQLLSDALAENPGDAAAIALHARLVAQREPVAAAERYAALGQAIEPHSKDEAAAHFLESGAWYERAGNRERAAEMGRRALSLAPRHMGALRLLMRTLPSLGASAELADLLDQAAGQLPRGLAAEVLARAAALLGGTDPDRAILLAQRAADMARGLVSPRWLELWAALAFKAGDLRQLSQALEARADSTQGPDAADLLLEASELCRAAGEDARSTALLRKARGLEPSSSAARNALLALPGLPDGERAELLAEEARSSAPERAAALHAERAAVLELSGRVDEAVQASAQALALGGVDLAVLRRLARMQLRRGDHAAALAVLVQIAEAVPEGNPRAEAYGRAAELAEWRVGDARRAVELYRAAAKAQPQASFAWAHLARLLTWTGAAAESAQAHEQLAQAAQSLAERNEARRWAASLYAHRAGAPDKAAALLRVLLDEAPGDLEAAAALLEQNGEGEAARKERVELRGQLASRCQDPRLAAVLRAESGEDRLAAGDRDEGIAEYRRALALNPQDRVALDLVEEALRNPGQKDLLAEHLAFRCAFEQGETRAALALQQAEIFAADGRLEEASAAYALALASDPDSLRAVEKTARGTQATDGESVQQLTALLEADPGNSEVALKLRGKMGHDAPALLADLYEKIGEAHGDARLGAVAWTQAASIRLRELEDAASAFAASGRAILRDPESPKALEARADAAEAAGHPQDAADALRERLTMASPDEPRAADWKLRLGRCLAEVGDAAGALPLLGAALDSLEAPVLLKLAPGARSLQKAEAMRLYGRLLEVFPVPQEPAPSRVQLAEWTDEVARCHLSLDQPAEALAAFKRSVQLEPRNRSALRHVADLSEQVAPEQSIAAHRTLLDMMPPDVGSLHKLVSLFQATGRTDAATCAAAALVGVGAATPQERALHDAAVAKPPPVELPQLADGALVHAAGDEGAVRELLAAAAPELARALPTDMSGGRGALVKGDNPVRRVVAAIARALEIPEPQLFVARAEPAVVLPVSGDVPGLLVGGEVPKRFTPRQQRFLYARALAHIRRGTHMLAGLPAARLAALVGELIRLTAPAGVDQSRLPPSDAALAEALGRHVGPEAQARLAPLARRACDGLPTNWEPLALGIRESAERAGLLACADPAAAIGLVAAETQGNLDRSEIARLVRFAVSEPYFESRA